VQENESPLFSQIPLFLQGCDSHGSGAENMNNLTLITQFLRFTYLLYGFSKNLVFGFHTFCQNVKNFEMKMLF
jgi:hypothetical protein